MNKLSIEKKAQVIKTLVEGTSIRGTVRITGVAKNTIVKLLAEIGQAAETFHNETVKNLQSKRVEADEIWSFVYSKEKNVPEHMNQGDVKEAGDVWTWTAMDSDSKLIISWLVADRGVDSARMFMGDVAARLANRVQLSTDGYRNYLVAVGETFGTAIDYAQIVKIYGNTTHPDTRYSLAECTGTKKTVVSGKPTRKDISTSYVERQNLTMRMHMRRFTRLTNAFSKKIENHRYAIALHFFYYNFVRVHQTLRVTPAMESGLTARPLTLEFLVEMTEKQAVKK
jgi:IS1 family transposase